MRPASLLEPFVALRSNRSLIKRLAGRDIAARWRGSLLGPLWAVAAPLLLLSVYSFVFATILKTRWPAPEGSSGETPAPFAIILFSGLVVFQLFAETINASPSLIRNNTVYVKQVLFPLEILPAVSLLVALFNAGVSALVLAAGYLLLYGPPPLSVLWLPLILLPVPFLALGLAWLFAAIGTFLRDTVQIVALLTTVLMFLSPIFYSIDMVPASYRPLVWSNPLSGVLVQTRDALFHGRGPTLLPFALSWGFSFFCFYLGYHFFRRAKNAFADVV